VRISPALARWIISVSIVALLGGCGSAGGSSNVSTAPPAPTVTASLSASTTDVNTTVTLTWSSNNASACAIAALSLSNLPASGSQSVTPTSAGTFNYTVTCTGGGGTGQQTVTLTVPSVPTAALSSSASSSFVGQPVTLTWSSQNASSCTASGSWTGSLGASGTQIVVPSSSGNIVYTLVCAGPGGTSTPSNVTVVASTPSASLTNTFAPNTLTISTSEGAPYGDCDFWVNGPSNCWNSTQFGYGPTKVMRLYICLSGEVSFNSCTAQPTPSGPLPSLMLTDIDSRLGAFAGTGMRLLLRFAYNDGPSGSLSGADVPASLISSHIDQLAPIVLKYRDLVFALQAGFIGQWGEWHDSTNGNVAAGPEKTVLDKEASYFAGVFPILVRYPGALVQYTGNLTPPENFGLHDDGFASDPQPDPDTNPCRQDLGYCLNQYTQQQLVSYKTVVANNTMFVAEPWQVNSTDQSCSMLDSLSYGTPLQSFTLLPYPLSIGQSLVSQGCATSFFSKVGTRIELQKAVFIGNVRANGQLYVALTLANAGYGRVVRARPAALVLLSSGVPAAQIQIPLSVFDLSGLTASATTAPQTYQFTVIIPGTFSATGSVAVALLIPDPAPSLTNQAAYALPLNSVDQGGIAVFDPSTGYNVLGAVPAN
jgi:hypothetical protein